MLSGFVVSGHVGVKLVFSGFTNAKVVFRMKNKAAAG
jgi:hypothetical protein